VARTLVLCALATACAGPALAADRPAPAKTVVRLTVSPMAAPTPALKYQLLPELREMHAGNPVQGYMLCFMEQNHFFFDKKVVERRAKYLTMPLAKLPVKELRDYGRGALTRADYAARLTTPDWQVLHRMKRDGVYTILPEVGQFRRLAEALKVRFRGEVASRRFDDAVRSAKTMLALARHLGQHPTLIGELVGVSLASSALGTLDEMVGQPGCPNLYWALTQLPDSFADLRKGAQGERLMWNSELASLHDRGALTPAELDQVVKQIKELIKVVAEGPKPGPKEGVDAWLAARLEDAAHVRAARKRLVESGVPAGRVKTFPARQVVLLDEKRAFAIQRDDALKLLALPYSQFEALQARRPAKKDSGLFAGFASAVVNVHRAETRLRQRIALLRHVEALRLYAAAHRKFPAKLADVEVPLPVDPFTGKAFAYEYKDGTARLRGTPPRGKEKAAGFNVVYELKLRK
jgi:hypothetical protein